MINHHQPLSVTAGLTRGLLILSLVAGLLLGILPAPAARALTWYVAVTGNDGNPCTSPAAACRTIGAALNHAGAGDTINIAAGTYFENVGLAKSVSLAGAGQIATVIDGSGLGPVVSITSESGGITVNLSGLTLQNGAFGLGGGIHSESGTGLVTVSDSRIVNNSAFTGGGGIFSQGNLKLLNVTLQGNTNTGTQRGGGLLSLGTAELVNVTVLSNTAATGGGGIANFGTLTVTNSLIGSGNQAGQGGGIFNYGSGAKMTLTGSTISSNSATGTGGGLYNEGGQLIIASTVISGNQATGSGGGIFNGNLGQSVGRLTLSNSTLRANITTSSLGGGLNNEATATIDTTTFVSNRAEGSGGAIYNNSTGQLSVINSTLNNNLAVTAPGGGLLNRGTATLNGVQLIGNTASSASGGGIENSANATLVLDTSTLTGNQALNSLGGGLHNYASAQLHRVTLQSNSAAGGGGIYNEAAGNLDIEFGIIISNTANTIGGGGLNNQGALAMRQSSIVYNAAASAQGGGLYNKATAELENVTLSNNAAQSTTASGGAAYNDGGDLTLSHTTISHNRAPAVVNFGAGAVNIINSIVASNTVGFGGTVDSCSGVITSDGHNLDSGTSCGFGGGSLNNTNPQLGPLQDNGGGTLSRIILVSSPAVDAADDAVCAPTDQRGVTRPQGNSCDIGAYEVIGYTNSTPGDILPGQCLTSTTVISSNFVIGSLHVGVNLIYAPRGDLRIDLLAPGKAPVNLLADTGGSGQNLDVLWDDDEPDPVGTEDHDAAFPYYDYPRRPDHPLTPLFGSSIAGSWQLRVCNVGTGTGTLNRWSLIVPEIKNPRVMLPIVRR